MGSNNIHVTFGILGYLKVPYHVLFSVLALDGSPESTLNGTFPARRVYEGYY